MRRVLDDGSERPLSSEEEIVLVIDPFYGELVLDTEDYSLDGEIWTIKLWMKSTFSDLPDTASAYLFDIEFKDPCWASVLFEPVFDLTYAEYDLW